MADFTVLSNFGVRYFLMPFATGSTATAGTIVLSADGKSLGAAAQGIPTAAELEDVLSCSIGEVSKDVKTFRTLNSDGWESAVSLGQALSEGSMSLIRTGTGNPYVGAESGSTYNKLRKWMADAAATGGSNAPKAILEIVPRGGSSYEGTIYRCVPTNFDPGERNTSDGQEYSISVQPFGCPISVVPTASSTSGQAFTISNPGT